MISGDAPEERSTGEGSVRVSAGTLHPTDEKRACVSDAATTSSAETVEPAPGHPVRRILIIVGTVICGAAFASVVGWDIRGWFSDLWNTVTSISVEYIIAAVIAMIVQTTATAFAWFSILRYAYPGEVRWMQVYAAYAACVAMNNILPANLGTIVMFVMLTTVIASATFAGMLGGFMVQKIFFVLAGAFVYLYLFLSVPGSFDIDFSWIKEHPWAVAILLVVGRRGDRPDGPSLLAEGRHVVGGGEGGRPDPGATPAPTSAGCSCPSSSRWVAGLCVVAIFLAAYAIPVTFHSVMSVVGSNSISNTVVADAGWRRRQPGVQRRRPERRHRLADGDRLLGRAATGLDGMVDPVRARPDDLDVRLGRRQDARATVVRGGEEEGGRAEGRSRAMSDQAEPREPEAGPARLPEPVPETRAREAPVADRSRDCRAPGRGVLLRRLPAGADDRAEAELAADRERDHRCGRAAGDASASRHGRDPKPADVGMPYAWSTAATIEPWPEGKNFFPRIFADIEQAHSSVHILMFGWREGRDRHEARRPPRRRR